MLSIFFGPFSIFYLIIFTKVSAIVPPPENVTVSCQNDQIFVYWNYSKQLPQTSFRLDLREYDIVTNELQHNLTKFIWASEQHYMAFHSVKLKAIQGGHNESITVDSQSFTFNSHTSASINCKLYFPPVKLSVKESTATVRFENPLHTNENLKGLTLIYSISRSDNVLFLGSCSREESICTSEIAVQQGEDKQCLNLKGQMVDGNNWYFVPFKETSICSHAEPSQAPYLLLFSTIIAVFVIVIIMLTLIIWKVKACSITEPKIMDPMISKSTKCILEVSNENISRITDVSSNLSDTPDTSISLTAASSKSTPPGSMYMEGGLSENDPQEEHIPHYALLLDVDRSYGDILENDPEGEHIPSDTLLLPILDVDRSYGDIVENNPEGEHIPHDALLLPILDVDGSYGDIVENDPEEEKQISDYAPRPRLVDDNIWIDMGNGDFIECYRAG